MVFPVTAQDLDEWSAVVSNSFVMDAAVVQVSKPVVITRHEDLSQSYENGLLAHT